MLLIIAAIGSDAQRADAVAVVARLLERVGDGVVQIVEGRSLLDVGVEGRDHVARDAAFHPQRIHAQATGFTEFLQAAR